MIIKVIVKGLLSGDSLFVLTLKSYNYCYTACNMRRMDFREGTLQRLFSEKNEYTFSCFCLLYFLVSFILNFPDFLPRIVLGMFLGHLYYYSGSLWVNIYAHVVNNGAQVVFLCI